MSSFELAIPTIMQHEGFLSQDPDDPGNAGGGATKFGVTVPTLQRMGVRFDLDGDGEVDAEDVRALKVEDARAIYKELWWDWYDYGRLEDQAVATKVFDLSVNMGRWAHVALQRALRACAWRVAEDGVIGPQTIHAVNGAAREFLLPAFRSEAAGIYRTMAAKNPALLRYLKGWLERAYDEPYS